MQRFELADSDWMPEHYTELQQACLSFAGSRKLTPMDFGITISGTPDLHVPHLSSAASKFRLARHCTGFAEPSPEERKAHRIGRGYFEKYSAQLLVMLGFVALETHLRMLGLDWRECPLNAVVLTSRNHLRPYGGLE